MQLRPTKASWVNWRFEIRVMSKWSKMNKPFGRWYENVEKHWKLFTVMGNTEKLFRRVEGQCDLYNKLNVSFWRHFEIKKDIRRG